MALARPSNEHYESLPQCLWALLCVPVRSGWVGRSRTGLHFGFTRRANSRSRPIVVRHRLRTPHRSQGPKLMTLSFPASLSIRKNVELGVGCVCAIGEREREGFVKAGETLGKNELMSSLTWKGGMLISSFFFFSFFCFLFLFPISFESLYLILI